MTALLLYLLEVIVCSALFAGCYWLVLRNERSYRWNRFYIPAAVTLSVVIPLLNIPIASPHLSLSDTTDYMAHIIVAPAEVTAVAATSAASSFSWSLIPIVICISIAFLLFAKELVSLVRILQLKRRAEKIRTTDVDLYCTDDESAPFTFFRTIFWKKGVPVDSDEGRYMLRHELAHVRLGHSRDKAFMQFVCCIFWMNPFFMLLRRELELVHEFAADNESIGEGNAEALSSLILCTLYPHHYHNFTSRFFQSSIKRRIAMITNNKKSNRSLLRKLSVVPVILIALYFFACKSETHDPAAVEVLTEAEVMPAFNGKSAAEGFQEFFNQNSQFNANMSNRGWVGVAMTSVVVDGDGKVAEVNIDDLSPLLKKQGVSENTISAFNGEIEHLLKSAPGWTPGRQNGKDVSVQVKVPVRFSIAKTDMSRTVANEETFTIVDDMPLFNGEPAETGFRDYVMKNTVYPAEARDQGISGRVFVEFTIDSEGNLTDTKVMRSVDPLLDAEALRVISSSPQWKPGYHKGKAVAVKYTFPVRFKLDN